MKRALYPAVLCLLAWLAMGCDDVTSRSFGGVIGVVGHPAIADCPIDVYNALEFEALDSTAGLIATGLTTEAGRFRIALDEEFLGRPLILVARPDAGAMYRDFGAAGTPDIPFDGDREPWVAVHPEWLGGESVVAINPPTTMAFHALMRLPTQQVGEASLRFESKVVGGVHSALAASFGLISNLGTSSPAPPGGPLFEPLETFHRENTNRSTAYTYVGLQLAKAANAFVALTTDPNDTALDFYEALFRDARDGVLDGSVYGVPDPFLNEVPAVVGRDVDGASRLLRWISTNALDATEEDYAGDARNGRFSPEPADIIALQADATGSVRPTRITRFDVRNFSNSGFTELTLEGEGFRRTDRFIIRSFTSASAEWVIDRDSVGVDGNYLFHSDSELRVRLPDFTQTTLGVPGGLQVASGADFRRVRFIVQNQPALEADPLRDVFHQVTDNARLTNRSELLLVNVAMGRVEASGEFRATEFANNIYDDATDPALLDPATDNVYELRVRVANPSLNDVDDVQLDFASSVFTQLGVPVVADVFGGTEPGRALIFEAPAPVTINPGAVEEIRLRFIFLDTAIPADLLEGAAVRMTPTMIGTSTGPGTPVVTTSDVVGFNRSVEIGPAAIDPTAIVDTPAAPVMPASLPAGDVLEIELQVAVVAQGGGTPRSLRVTDIDLSIDFDGEQTELRLTDSFFETRGASGLYIESVTRASDNKGLPVHLFPTLDTETVIVRVRTDPGRSGVLTAEFTAHAIDVATRQRSSSASGPSAVTITP